MDNFGKTPPAARTNVRRIWHIPMKAVRFDRDYFGNHRGIRVVPGPFADAKDAKKAL